MLHQAKAGFKNAFSDHANFFEALNFRYFGPVDGHDVIKLTDILGDLKQIPGPKLLHVITTKGKGFSHAEKEKTLWHFPGLFDKGTGEIIKKDITAPQPPKYQDVFGNTIVELAELNDKIIGITPAMLSGSSLKFMMEKMPARTFDVGICEQHAVALSAGLATQGLKVFCNIYSSFMQRGYDQMIHDVVLQKLPVIFCLDRGGLVGEDGATHHGIFDIAYSRCLPGIVISAPMNESELRNLMYTAQLDKTDRPFIIRYPRGQGVMPDWRTPFREIEIGKGRIIREGADLAILSFGHPGNFAVDACTDLEQERIYPGLFDMRFVKPMDQDLLHYVFQNYKYVITVEDGCQVGGFGTAVAEFRTRYNYLANLQILGVPDHIVEHGKVEELYKECLYDKQSIIATVRAAKASLEKELLTVKVLRHESI